MVLASMLCSVPSIQQIEPKTISKHKRLSTNQSRNAHSFLLSLKNLGTKTFETICRQIPSSVDNQTCNFFLFLCFLFYHQTLVSFFFYFYFKPQTTHIFRLTKPSLANPRNKPLEFTLSPMYSRSKMRSRQILHQT